MRAATSRVRGTVERQPASKAALTEAQGELAATDCGASGKTVSRSAAGRTQLLQDGPGLLLKPGRVKTLAPTGLFVRGSATNL